MMVFLLLLNPLAPMLVFVKQWCIAELFQVRSRPIGDLDRERGNLRRQRPARGARAGAGCLREEMVVHQRDGEVFCARHLSEQYFTCSQFFAHALRQVMGLPHTAQGLLGKKPLLPRNDP